MLGEKTECLKVYGQRKNSEAPKDGIKVLIDAEDEDRVKDRRWHVRRTNGVWNVYTPIYLNGGLTYWSLHRFLLGLDARSVSPHVILKDRSDTKPSPEYLNFKKDNLDFQNNFNRSPRKTVEGNYDLFSSSEQRKKESILIQYVYEDNKKIGCVIAKSPTEIAWSMCANEDIFSKKEAKEIAMQRLRQGIPYQILFLKKLTSKIVPSDSKNYKFEDIKDWFDSWDGEYNTRIIEPLKAHRFRVLWKSLKDMEQRASKYYK